MRCSPRPSIRPRARARAHGCFTRSFKFVRNADPPRARRTPGFDRRRRRVTREIRETEFRDALSASHVNLTPQTCRFKDSVLEFLSAAFLLPAYAIVRLFVGKYREMYVSLRINALLMIPSHNHVHNHIGMISSLSDVQKNRRVRRIFSRGRQKV